MERGIIAWLVLLSIMAIAAIVVGSIALSNTDNKTHVDESSNTTLDQTVSTLDVSRGLTVNGTRYPTTKGKTGQSLNLISENQLAYGTTKSADVMYTATSDYGTSKLASSNVQNALTELDSNLTKLNSSKINVSDVTGKGSLLSTTGSELSDLKVGTNGHVLMADSTTATGLKWSLSVPNNPVFYVKDDGGDDTNPGTEAAPFKTFEAAAFQTMQSYTGTAVINVAGGNYEISSASAWEPFGKVKVVGTLSEMKDGEGKLAVTSAVGSDTSYDFDTLVAQTDFTAADWKGLQIVIQDIKNNISTTGIVLDTDSNTKTISVLNSGMNRAYSADDTFQVMSYDTTFTFAEGKYYTKGQIEYQNLKFTTNKINAQVNSYLAGDIMYTGCYMKGNGTLTLTDLYENQDLEYTSTVDSLNIGSTSMPSNNIGSYISGTDMQFGKDMVVSIQYSSIEAGQLSLSNRSVVDVLRSSCTNFVVDVFEIHCDYSTFVSTANVLIIGMRVSDGSFYSKTCSFNNNKVEVENAYLKADSTRFQNTLASPTLLKADNSNGIISSCTFVGNSGTTEVAIFLKNGNYSLNNIAISDLATAISLVNANCYINILTGAVSATGILLTNHSAVSIAGTTPSLTATSQVKVGANPATTFVSILKNSKPELLTDFTAVGTQVCSVQKV
jgi:hypothetical protein